MTAQIEDYEKISNPLTNMRILLNTLLAVIGAMSILVLSLMQSLFHKTHEHEVGIMLSIGISKADLQKNLYSPPQLYLSAIRRLLCQ